VRRGSTVRCATFPVLWGFQCYEPSSTSTCSDSQKDLVQMDMFHISLASYW
jgi:hypothetical protein